MVFKLLTVSSRKAMRVSKSIILFSVIFRLLVWEDLALYSVLVCFGRLFVDVVYGGV